MSISCKLALGTAQFGLAYGVANESGKVASSEVEKILCNARRYSIKTIDTAIAYGDSEVVLGKHDLSSFQVITKLPEIPENEIPAVWIERQMQQSLDRLGLDRLHGVLLHRPNQLFEPCGAAIYEALVALRKQGIVQKIGISIYSPYELEQLAVFDFDIYQAPFSMLDTRMLDTGWLQRIRQRGAELHARSVFLQGLLLIPAEQRPSKFSQWQAIWDTWSTWLKEAGIEPTVACLQFVLQQPLIDRVVVGVDSSRQWQELIEAANRTEIHIPQLFKNVDERLLNPGLWEKI